MPAGVAQGAADPRRVVVLVDVARECADALGAPALAAGPDLGEGPVGGLDDLVHIPLLEVDLVRALDHVRIGEHESVGGYDEPGAEGPFLARRLRCVAEKPLEKFL